jgi:hypothetical protein
MVGPLPVETAVLTRACCVPSCREQAVALALRSRRKLLQRIAQGLLQALSYCH